MLISYFGSRIFLKLPADVRNQLKKAAAADAFGKISYIPSKKLYEKYMKISVALAYFISGQTPT